MIVICPALPYRILSPGSIAKSHQDCPHDSCPLKIFQNRAVSGKLCVAQQKVLSNLRATRI